MNLWLRDPKTHRKSATLTLFVCAFIAATLKLMLSGMVIAGITFSVFSGSEFALVIGAAGAIYFGRKWKDGPNSTYKEPNQEISEEDK